MLVILMTALRAEEVISQAEYWEKPLAPAPVTESSLRSAPGFFQAAALVLIRVYQKAISTQDLPSCVFHPSCSRFAFGAIEHFGIWRGILLAGDRLLRCNPFAAGHYPSDGQKLSDPIEHYEIRPNH